MAQTAPGWLVSIPLALVVVACGSSSGSNGPTATPLPRAELQRQYVQAADSYNVSEAPVTQAENQYCAASSASASLNQCEAALSKDRLATITYDDAVRAISFPVPYRADVSKLLSDDSQLESLLQQAATAPSLSAIDALSSQIFSLLRTTSQDATKLRADLGLPAASEPAGG